MRHSLNDQVCVSLDLKWVAITAAGERRPGDEVFRYDTVYLLNLDTGACERLPDSETAVLSMGFFDNRLAVMRCDNYTISVKEGNGSFDHRLSIACLIEAYETTTGERLWVCEQEYSKPVQIAEIECVPFDNETGAAILTVFSDRSVLLDPETGSVICKFDLYDAASNVHLFSNGFETVNVDGSCTQVYYDLERSKNVQYFSDPISDVCRSEDTFYIQRQQRGGLDNTIYKYELSQYDDSYELCFETEKSDWEVYDVFPSEQGTKILLAQEHQVRVVDFPTGETRSYRIPEEYAFSLNKILRGPSGESGLYWSKSIPDGGSSWLTDEYFYWIDLETGKIQQLQPPQPPTASTIELGRIFCGDKLLVPSLQWEPRSEEHSKLSDQLIIYAWDLRKNDFQEIGRMALPALEAPLMSFVLLIRSSLAVDEEENRLSFALRPYDGASPSSLVQVDLDSGTVTEIPLSFDPELEPTELVPWKAHCLKWNPTGTQAVFVFEDMLYSVNADGQLQYAIPVEGTAAFVQLSPDQESFFLFTEETQIARYRLSDGLYEGKIDLKSYSDNAGSLYSIGVYAGELKWELLDDATMAVYTSLEGYLLDISGKTIKIKAIVDGYNGYDPKENRFVVSERSDSSCITIGSFPYYTQEDIVRLAGNALGR